MEPTLLKGDHIWVRRSAYGIKNPLTDRFLLKFRGPQRGDVIVFRYPDHQNVYYVKRVIGLPGDTIQYKDGTLYINQQKIRHDEIQVEASTMQDHCVARLSETSAKIIPQYLKPFPYSPKFEQRLPKLETLPSGHQYLIQRQHILQNNNDFTITVPNESYFVMGDNRDRSQDSRQNELVLRKDITGRASSIWLSLNQEPLRCHSPFSKKGSKVFRWYRFDRDIN